MSASHVVGFVSSTAYLVLAGKLVQPARPACPAREVSALVLGHWFWVWFAFSALCCSPVTPTPPLHPPPSPHTVFARLPMVVRERGHGVRP